MEQDGAGWSRMGCYGVKRSCLVGTWMCRIDTKDPHSNLDRTINKPDPAHQVTKAIGEKHKFVLKQAEQITGL